MKKHHFESTINGHFPPCSILRAIVNHPFGNGSYHLFMLVWGMAYYCFNHTMCGENMVEQCQKPPMIGNWILIHFSILNNHLYCRMSTRSIPFLPSFLLKCSRNVDFPFNQPSKGGKSARFAVSFTARRKKTRPRSRRSCPFWRTATWRDTSWAPVGAISWRSNGSWCVSCRRC